MCLAKLAGRAGLRLLPSLTAASARSEVEAVSDGGPPRFEHEFCIGLPHPVPRRNLIASHLFVGTSRKDV